MGRNERVDCDVHIYWLLVLVEAVVILVKVIAQIERILVNLGLRLALLVW